MDAGLDSVSQWSPAAFSFSWSRRTSPRLARDTSTSSGTSNQTPAGDGATRVYPNSRIVGLNQTAWDHVKVSVDGKRVVVYFWMGVQACYGLGQVDVSRHDGQLKIQLWTGIRPRAIGMVCPELAQLYKTVIHLNRPIIAVRCLLADRLRRPPAPTQLGVGFRPSSEGVADRHSARQAGASQPSMT